VQTEGTTLLWKIAHHCILQGGLIGNSSLLADQYVLPPVHSPPHKQRGC